MLPLYEHGNYAPAKYDHNAGFNTGLWYDKFYNKWFTKAGKNSSTEWSLEDKGKWEWVKELDGRAVGDSGLLSEAVERMVFLALARQGGIRCLATDWRFVTGLGWDHPVENGFTWHHPLGVPYLPGSTVKGVVRAWTETLDNVTDAIKRIFGPEGESVEKMAGSVIFFDALPVDTVKVQADVMTPHYDPYYKNSDKGNGTKREPPADWFNPIPIPFLTVAPGQVFLFAIAPRRPGIEEDRQDCNRVLEWLEKALAFIGAGAKTAAGYGRFSRRQETEARWQEKWEQHLAKANRASMSPIRLAMEEDGYSCEPERFIQALTTRWLPRMADEKTG